MPKPISDKAIDVLEDGALEGVKHLRAFLAYEGDNPRFYQKAKVGGVLVSSYVKAIATQTNRMAVEQAMNREVKTLNA
jgi:hypothetical protein